MKNVPLFVVLGVLIFLIVGLLSKVEKLEQQNQALAHSVYTGIWYVDKKSASWSGWTKGGCEVRWFGDMEPIGDGYFNTAGAWRRNCKTATTTIKTEFIDGGWGYLDGVQSHPLEVVDTL